MSDDNSKVKLGDDGEIVGLQSDSAITARNRSIPYEKPIKNRITQNSWQIILTPRLSFEFTATRSLDSCITRLRKAWRPKTMTNLPGTKMEGIVKPISVNVARFEVKFEHFDWRYFFPVNPISGQLERLENGDTLVKGEI